jgi:chromosomal replication initiation ATPase DnaA
MLTQKLKTERLNASPFITLYLPSTPKQRISYFALPGMKGKKKVPIVKSNRDLIEHIIDTVCNYFEVDKKIVMGVSRERKFVMPRQIIHWYLINKLGMKLKNIGAIFNQDHSTIFRSRNVVNDNLSFKFDNEYKTHIENLNVIL